MLFSEVIRTNQQSNELLKIIQIFVYRKPHFATQESIQVKALLSYIKAFSERNFSGSPNTVADLMIAAAKPMKPQTSNCCEIKWETTTSIKNDQLVKTAV